MNTLAIKVKPITFFAVVTLVILWPQSIHADIVLSDFSSVTDLNLQENAIQFVNRLRLTPSHDWMYGSAWYIEKQSVIYGFETTFDFQITDQEVGGSDGFAFVVQNSSNTALGNIGGWMGYSLIPNCIAIEFDTWDNFEFPDPDDNHISIQTRGTEENTADHTFSLGSTSAIPNMSDSSIHTVRITYTPDTLSVFLDDLVTPCLTTNVDFSSLLDLNTGQAWVGFTAATGTPYENHDILSWEFREVLEPSVIPAPGALILGSIGLSFSGWRLRKRQIL